MFGSIPSLLRALCGLRGQKSALVVLAVLLSAQLPAEDIRFTARSRTPGKFEAKEEARSWDAAKTAVVICDMWDKHWCAGATGRVGEMAPRMNEVVAAMRSKGALIIHCPSDTMSFYKDTPQRAMAMAAPKVETKIPLERWRYINKEKEGKLPIDDSDGGCDCVPQCKNFRAWSRQIDAIKIESNDAITDSPEAFYLMQQRGIENVLVMGVHTNMCVLGRPFSIRQMVTQGKNVVLVRDMTDTMYNPRKAPVVSHFSGTDLVVEHIEKHWCPTTTSADLIGGKELRFKNDSRPRLTMLISEDEYHADESLPPFAEKYLRKDFRVNLVFGDEKDKNSLSGVKTLPDSDVLLVYMRRKAMPAAQLDIVKKFVASGKPVIGIRTASHAFALRGAQKAPEGSAQWPEFDKEVLGGNYHDHYANNKEGSSQTFVRAAVDAKQNSLMRGVSRRGGTLPPIQLIEGTEHTEVAIASSLYKNAPIDAKAVVVMTGRYADNPPEPVAWTFTRENGGKTFYTSMGAPEDFKQPFFNRLLVNGIYWASGLPVPAETPGEEVNPNPPKPKENAENTIPEPITPDAKGVKEAFAKLRAPLSGGTPLSAADSKKNF